MSEQNDQRVLDAAELLAVASEVSQDLFLDRRVRGLPELNVDQSDLAADRVKKTKSRD